MEELPRRSKRISNRQRIKDGVVDTFLKNTSDDSRRSLRLQNIPPKIVTATPIDDSKLSNDPPSRAPVRRRSKRIQLQTNKAIKGKPVSLNDTSEKITTEQPPTAIPQSIIKTTESSDNSTPSTLHPKKVNSTKQLKTQTIPELKKLKELFSTKRITKSDIKKYNLSPSDVEFINKIEPLIKAKTTSRKESTKPISICFVGVVYSKDSISQSDCTEAIQNYILYHKTSTALPIENIYQQNRMERALDIYNNDFPFLRKHIIDIRGDNIHLKTFTFKYKATVHIIAMGTKSTDTVYKHLLNSPTTNEKDTTSCDLRFSRQSQEWIEYAYTYPTTQMKEDTVPNFPWEPTEMFIYTHPDTIALGTDDCNELGIVQEPIGCSCLDNYYRSPTTPDNETSSGCKHMWYIRYLIIMGVLSTTDSG